MSIQSNNRTKLISPKNSITQLQHSIKQKHSLKFPLNSPHTRQEFKEESDINTIMSRYMRTGELPHVNSVAPQYFDASGIDFQTHMEAVASAKSLFAQLPSHVRARFFNDPGQFIDFCGEEGNRSELAHMGLLSPEATRKALTPPVPIDLQTKPAPEPLQAPAPKSEPSA